MRSPRAPCTSDMMHSRTAPWCQPGCFLASSIEISSASGGRMEVYLPGPGGGAAMERRGERSSEEGEAGKGDNATAREGWSCDAD